MLLCDVEIVRMLLCDVRVLCVLLCDALNAICAAM